MRNKSYGTGMVLWISLCIHNNKTILVLQYKSLDSISDRGSINFRNSLWIGLIKGTETSVYMVWTCDAPKAIFIWLLQDSEHDEQIFLSVFLYCLHLGFVAFGQCCSRSRCGVLNAVKLENVRDDPGIVLRTYKQEISNQIWIIILDKETFPLFSDMAYIANL